MTQVNFPHLNDVIMFKLKSFSEAMFSLKKPNRLNPILHGLFQAGSTWGGGGHKVPAAFFSETVKATTIKLGTLTN